MYVRLAFAVAAHLEPEILIVDEVLAVGDAAFQKKCLGKMGDVAAGGRTVLFVSHNMAAVSSLCDKAILLAAGRVAAVGPTDQVLETYSTSGHAFRSLDPGHAHRIDRTLEVTGLQCVPEVVPSGDPACIRLELASLQGARVEELAILIYAASGERIAILDLREPDAGIAIPRDGHKAWQVEVAQLGLVEGEYSLGVFCRTAESRGNHYDLGRFSVTPGATSCLALPYAAQHRGHVELAYRFRIGE